jgi:nicotinamide riboside transporter PnuC
MALAGLSGLLGAELTRTTQNLALALLVIHALELVVMFKHVRLYRGSLLMSMVLTMLFGVLHWRPLARDAAKNASDT